MNDEIENYHPNSDLSYCWLDIPLFIASPGSPD
jgi:hypothetical protein